MSIPPKTDAEIARDLGANMQNLINEIDRFYRETNQTDPPLDAGYIATLPQKIKDNYTQIAELALAALGQQGLPTPAPADNATLTSLGVLS